MRHLTRIGGWILGVILLGTVVFSSVRIQRERSMLLDDLDRRARVIAKSLGPASLRALKQPSPPDEEQLAERLSGQGRTMGILVCGADGRVVARSAALEDIALCEDPEIQAILSTGVEQIHFGERMGRSLHRLIYPLRDRDNTLLGTLTIVHEAAYIDKRVASAVMWTTLTVALIALLISAITYALSRRAFQQSVQEMLGWMRAAKESGPLPPPTESLLKPVTREVEKMAARLRAAKETAREVSAERQMSDLWTPARLKAHAVTHLGKRPLIVVSNRESYMHVKEQGGVRVMVPASGVVTALDPVLRATSGLWVAHGAGDADREVCDAESKVLVPPDAPTYTLKRIWLSREEEEGYYYGFSNEALWPLCHVTHHRPAFEERDWVTYRAVNQKFAAAVVEEFGRERPCVLVQDYHYTLLPQAIRARRPDAAIGLFWHIPWPIMDIFQICPWKREILEGMLGADFIGFHLPSYCSNFLEAVGSLLPVRVDWDRSAIVHEGGTTFVKPFPISIQPWAERGIGDDGAALQAARAWRREAGLDGVRLIVSVDRLDYTKGFIERLGAIDRLFEVSPALKGQVSFVQLAAPSRTHLPRYRDFATEVEKAVDQVNWRHGDERWKPVVFLKAHHDAATVYRFLRMADGCIVSSLADGMNLVAKEFVAARERADGFLILSEFTGAAREFSDALQVNPYARADFAETIRVGLEMPADEQRRRMLRMRARVAEHNVYRWAADLLSELAQAAEERSRHGVTPPAVQTAG